MGIFRRNKTKEKKKEETKHVSASKVYVKVYRKLGKELYSLAAEFEAVETNDKDTNRITINQEKMFKEDTNFTLNRVYENLYYNLELEGKEYKKQAELLKNKIKEQKSFLKKFESDDEQERIKLNTKYNFPDEELKLTQLNVLQESLKYQKLGTYVRLGKGGVRTYEFVSIDGVLYPFIFGGKYPRAHPDLTVKKKIFNQENTIFKQQTGLDQNKTLMWMIIIFIGICMLWSCGLGFWTYKNWQESNNLDLKINGAGITCNNNMATLSSKWTIVIDDYLELRKSEIEILKKNENDININNNNNNIVSPNK
jgi:hypothetical protein